jgi:hypothetical protein
MSKHTAKYISLKEVILQYVNQAELSPAAYLRLFSIAIRGLQELEMDVSGEPKTVILTVLPNKTVDLPVDYLEYTKIGVINTRGEVDTLQQNPDILNIDRE